MQPDKQRGARVQAIIVMGVCGSGKSTLGQMLAEALGCPFIEGDELHDPASVEKMRGGQPLADDDRWPWLDRLASALDDATARQGLAVAACSALKYRYRERLVGAIGAPSGFIMLEAERAELERRLDQRSSHYMPSSLVASQLAALERPHDGERAVILDAEQALEALCRAAREWLGR
jgi:gluconokinase